MTDRIHLGFEMGTGEKVSVPLHHAIVSGVTGLSGKTTAIAAMLSRLPDGYKSLVFSTKRGEISFEGAHETQPFYRATVDWEYVSGVLEAARKEKLKFERSWIIKASRGASTLRDVYQNIVTELDGGGKLRGLDESVWTVLRAYFEKVLPELESQPWAPSLDLTPGLNVMHLEHLSEEVQGLVIAASLEEGHRGLSNVILVIPEAWAFLPQQRGSPVKWAAQHIIRQGRARGVFLFLDSQDVTSVSKEVLKSVDLWILGRQREINEVRRILEQLPAVQKPKPTDVMTLGVGQFYVASEDWCRKVYVQPAGIDDEIARKVAVGEISISPSVPALLPQMPETPNYPDEEDPMTISDLRVQLANAEIQRDESQRQVLVLRDQLAAELLALQRSQEQRDAALEDLEAEIARSKLMRGAIRDFLGIGSVALPGPGSPHVDEETIVEKVLARVGTGRPVLHLLPVEALRHRFQQETVERLEEQIAALDETQKRALKWLLAIGKRARYGEIAAGLGLSLRDSQGIQMSRGIKDMQTLGLVQDDKSNGVKATVLERVSLALAPYAASPEDIEATYQGLLHALAEAM